MFKLDNDFLVSLGLGGLPVDEKNRLLQMIYERLEMNVGMRLAEKMTDQQLDEFESFIDQNNEAGALKWLETNFPNYKDVVAEELEKLKGEVSTAAPQILAAQGQGGQPAGQPAPQMQSNAQPVQGQQPTPAQQYYQQPQTGAPVQSQYSQPQPTPQYQQPAMPVTPQPHPFGQQQPQFAPQPQQAPQPIYSPSPQPQYSPPMQPNYAQPVQPAPQQPQFAPQQQPARPVPTQQPVYQPAPPTPQSPQMPTPQPGYAPPASPQPQQFTPPPPGFTPGQ